VEGETCAHHSRSNHDSIIGLIHRSPPACRWREYIISTYSCIFLSLVSRMLHMRKFISHAELRVEMDNSG
jgi:hypothetical protein